ncbi:oxidoreductase [Alloscardovia macacae]|uniref:Oxidoreductase n=1 Tax=Alloscardovia macacae TaxID=1160091 RepID=A0A1Y2SWT6_9BIFI|nr:Gfo/Idh/MocA family oxidoreductase [Alloscardovia macacae]OTA25721.1 oxidoreductase [Alloscardovia macacae]OTA28328.1 oxidoreductase [Alloscardovia macacae]
MINIAILGAGRIAQKMAKTVSLMESGPRYAGTVHLYAVATRDSLARAQAFADEYGVEVAYGSYADMLDDADVDLVYIATPHVFHAQQAIACMEAGKHVLVEKPFAVNAADALRMIEKSHETGLVCAEAIWTRYEPSRAIIQNVLDSGQIGDIVSMSGNLSYPMTHKERLVNPALAGGALLDVGIYPLNFVSMFMPGEVERVVSSARLSGLNGSVLSGSSILPGQQTDELSQTTLWYSGGQMASVTSSYFEVGDRHGVIRGTKGYLWVDNVNNPLDIHVWNSKHELVKSLFAPQQLTGFEYEVASTVAAISRGDVEPREMPHAETLRMMRLMDEIRAQWGLVYPSELE